MNYAALVTAIENYCENYETTFVSQIPTFVKAAEQRVYDTVRIPDLRRAQTAELTPNNAFLTSPTDFLAPQSLSITLADGSIEYLMNKDVEYLRSAYPGNTAGQPKLYALWDDATFQLAPPPDDNYTVELQYFYYPESIVTADNTWLGDNFEFVLLYGSLIEAYTFMKGEADVAAAYLAQYQASLALLVEYAERYTRQDTYRNLQKRKV